MVLRHVSVHGRNTQLSSSVLRCSCGGGFVCLAELVPRRPEAEVRNSAATAAECPGQDKEDEGSTPVIYNLLHKRTEKRRSSLA